MTASGVGSAPPTAAAAARHPVQSSLATGEALVEPLTARESEILQLLAEGYDNRGIADKLVVSVGTVRSHLNRLYAKLGVQSRTRALARGRALGLLT